MKKISFCIPTARNEINHLKLLLNSLKKNLNTLEHEILVFIDSDNQGTFDWLKTQKNEFPDLTIIKNKLGVPIGARNITYMFEKAKHDIVSHLQSDMVVCKNYDLEVLKYLEDENTIVCSTRIEPPLHPPSPEKITHDFGLDPVNFDLEGFTQFAEQHKKDKNIEFWFAPYTLYKHRWIELGGQDTLYRRSRDDSDLLYRFTLCNTKIVQVWNALVYHFTCTSSRGIRWWDSADTAMIRRTKLQEVADSIELARFLRRWPQFKHSTRFNPEEEYKYHISLNLKNTDPDDTSILSYYYLFQTISIDNEELYQKINKMYDTYHEPANELLNMTWDDWIRTKKYCNTWEFSDLFKLTPVSDDVVLDIDLKGKNFSSIVGNELVSGMNYYIHEYGNDDSLKAHFKNTTDGVVQINQVKNRIMDNKIIKNPQLDNECLEVI